MQGYNVAYVGNIAFEATDKDVMEFFKSCPATKVRLHTDKDTKRSKGYAHVHFGDPQTLDKAVALSGSDFFGRQIKVGYGQPKRT